MAPLNGNVYSESLCTEVQDWARLSLTPAPPDNLDNKGQLFGGGAPHSKNHTQALNLLMLPNDAHRWDGLERKWLNYERYPSPSDNLFALTASLVRCVSYHAKSRRSRFFA